MSNFLAYPRFLHAALTRSCWRRVGLIIVCVALELLVPNPVGAEPRSGTRSLAASHAASHAARGASPVRTLGFEASLDPRARSYVSAPDLFWPDCDGDGFGDPDDLAPPCGPHACVCVRNNTDCDDTLATVYPGAPQLCDGFNNDCGDPIWPSVPSDEADADGDGYSLCAGDCNNDSPSVNPGGVETCNAFDDDCDAVIDEGCDSRCAAPAFGVAGIVTYEQDDVISTSPAVAWSGNGYGLAWVEGLSFPEAAWSGFGRLDANGTVTARTSLSSGPGGGQPLIVWSGSQYGVVWYTVDVGPGGVSATHFSRFSAGGALIGTLFLQPYSEDYTIAVSSVIWTGREFAFAWTDSRWSNRGVVVARVSASGERLGEDVLAVPLEHITRSEAPQLAWNGSGFGLVWQESCLAFARLDPAGERLGDPTCVTQGALPRSLTWTGDGYSILWAYIPHFSTSISRLRNRLGEL